MAVRWSEKRQEPLKAGNPNGKDFRLSGIPTGGQLVIIGWPAPLRSNRLDCFCFKRERKGTMSIHVLGIDLGKNVCSLVGLDKAGVVVMRRRLRDGVVEFVGKLPACIVAMEACCGAHHLGRELEAAGHTIHLMSPEYGRPYGKANKNDDRDAEAIALPSAMASSFKQPPDQQKPRFGHISGLARRYSKIPALIPDLDCTP